MFIKSSKKWRTPEGDQSIMVPYTYYRLCESYREAGGKVRQRTVLGLGELLEFPTEAEKKELADLLTSLINEGSGKLCDNPRLYDAALGFYGNRSSRLPSTSVRTRPCARCFGISGKIGRAMPVHRYLPVRLWGLAAMWAGVPVATMRPPSSPPPGPMSTM